MPAPPPYLYTNQDATGYPTTFGGDGINHFVGGGVNFESVNGFGFAGENTTDTLDPDIVRFGAVVGTFSSAPTRSDWFFIGFGTTLTVPATGANLFVAVNDSFPSNNQGRYNGTLGIVAAPEPSALALILPGVLMGAGIVCRRGRKG